MGAFPGGLFLQCNVTLDTVFVSVTSLGLNGDPSCGPVVTFALT